jgi:hypothetical protein
VKGCHSVLSDPKATTRPVLKSTTTESVCPDAARYETACTPSAIFIVAYCFSSRDAPLPGPSITGHFAVLVSASQDHIVSWWLQTEAKVFDLPHRAVERAWRREW